MGDLSQLNWVQRMLFNHYLPLWREKAWQIANATKGQPIYKIRAARDEIGRIVPANQAWALPFFLESIYNNEHFCKLVGLRVCQWCFDDNRASERQVHITNFVIHIERMVDGVTTAGAISESWIRLCPQHLKGLDGHLTGIRTRYSTSDPDHITMQWNGNKEIILMPINPRLISGGRLLDTLNPQRLIVRDFHGQVIWTPK